MSTIHLKVKYPSGELTVSPEPSILIKDLKVLLAAKLGDGTTADRLRLIYIGRVMADDNTLAQYGVGDGQVIHMVIKPADVTQQPARPQPPADATSAPGSTAAGGMDSPTGSSDGPGVPGPGGVDMGGLFRGIFQNLQFAGPLVSAAIHRGVHGGGFASPAAASAAPTGDESSTGEHASAPRTQSRPATPQAQSQAQQQQQHFAFGIPGFPQGFPGMAGPGGRVVPPTQSAQAPLFHVHVHVTMDELEVLPARLSSFEQRMAARQPPQHVHVHVQQHDGPVNARGAANAAAARPNPQTSQGQPVPGAVAAGEPRRTVLSDIARGTGLQVGPTGEPHTLQDVLSEAVSNNLDMGEVMQMMQGDWSAVERTRPQLREFIMRRTGGNPTRQLREELVEESVIDIVEAFDRNQEVQAQVRQRARTGVAMQPLVRAFTRLALRDIVNLVVDGPPAGTAYGVAFRNLVVRHVGHAMVYAERNVVRNGAADVDALLDVALAVVVREGTRQKPELAGLAGMASMMVLPALRNWKTEYTQRLRREHDTSNLEMEMRRIVNVSTRGAAADAPHSQTFGASAGGGASATAAQAAAPPPAAPVGRQPTDADDALLDACLDEASHSFHAPPATGDVESAAALSRALEGSSIPEHLRREFVAMAQSDATQRPPPPPAHYFAGDRDAFE
jgi:hypothetical protein